MHLNHLSLFNFRCFARLDVDLPEGILILTGKNAQGKTSFLEAIFYLATYASFHTPVDRQLINFVALNEAQPFAKITADVHKNDAVQRMDVRIILDGNRNGTSRTRKVILIDGIKKNQQKAISTFNAVIFIPQMTRIIEEGPEERRRFLNMSISQVMPGYAQALGDYARTLEQRNALLKTLSERSGDTAQLDYWDAQLAAHGSILIAGRQIMIEELMKITDHIYHHLTSNSEELRLEYRPAFNPETTFDNQASLFNVGEPIAQYKTSSELQGEFEDALKRNRQADILRGVTTIGPHRDDLRIYSNGIDLSDYGSRGQIRTALLALKMAEVEWMRSKTDQNPVLLLDEVLAELDPQRRSDLLQFLSRYEQAVLTTTDLHLFSPSFSQQCSVWNIEAGKISPSI